MTKRTRLFDNLDHGLQIKALRKHCEEHWILLYVERWLKVFAVSRFERITEGSLFPWNRTIFKAA
ncbi:MAG: hypothetical protein ACT4O2_14705 [Beijerinckiaceae bacterium]